MSDELKFVAVAKPSDIAVGSIKGFTVGDKKIVVCNYEGNYHALDGVCSHAGGPLCRGELDGNLLVCPWHGWEYNVVTGVCEIEPTLKQAKYALKIENDEILVAVPAQ